MSEGENFFLSNAHFSLIFCFLQFIFFFNINVDDEDMSKASTALVDDVSVSSKEDSRRTNLSDDPSIQTTRKPFLGGYRNKLTGVIYHHAATQTIKPPWNYGVDQLFSR